MYCREGEEVMMAKCSARLFRNYSVRDFVLHVYLCSFRVIEPVSGSPLFRNVAVLRDQAVDLRRKREGPDALSPPPKRLGLRLEPTAQPREASPAESPARPLWSRTSSAGITSDE